MTAAATAHESVLVGVSVSEPDEYDLVSLGLSELHVRHAFIEIARHLLAAGHSLAYGGDFRHHGYTEAMLDLVRTYSRHDRPGPERIRIYSAWPRWVDMSADERAGLAGVASLVSVDRPTGCPERLAVVPGRSANERLWAAIALTEMRRRMNRDIGARVVLGGRPSGQEGLLPGVVEEASLALAERTPLFVVGGFGGAASLIAAGLRGENPPELTRQYQESRTPGYADLWGLAENRGVQPSFDGLLAQLSGTGAESLANGLTIEQNLALMSSDDVDESVALIGRGLRSLGDQPAMSRI